MNTLFLNVRLHMLQVKMFTVNITIGSQGSFMSYMLHLFTEEPREDNTTELCLKVVDSRISSPVSNAVPYSYSSNEDDYFMIVV